MNRKGEETCTRIREHVRAHGPCTTAEIAAALNISVQTVCRWLDAEECYDVTVGYGYAVEGYGVGKLPRHEWEVEIIGDEP